MLRWPGRLAHPVASVTHGQGRKGVRERDRGLILCWATLFLEFCRIVITEQSHSCSVPNIPAGQTGKKIRESNDQSYSLHQERPDVIVQIQKSENVHTSHPLGLLYGAVAGLQPANGQSRAPMARSAELHASAFPLCFLEVIQKQQGEWK